jgi:hypothetical protein
MMLTSQSRKLVHYWWNNILLSSRRISHLKTLLFVCIVLFAHVEQVSAQNVTKSDGWYHGKGTGYSHTFVNYTVPSGSNRLLVLAFATENSGSLRSVRFGGVNMTSASELLGVEGSGHAAIYYLKEADIPSGAQNFSISFSRSGGTVYGYALFTNVDQNLPIVTGGSAQGSTTNDYSTYVGTGSFNTLKGGLSIAVVLNGSGDKSYAWSSGFTQMFEGNTAPYQSMGGSVAQTNVYSSSGVENAGCNVTRAPNYRLVIAAACFNPVSSVNDFLNVTPSNQLVSSSSGSTSFSTSSNVSWTVSDGADWLTVSPASGMNNGTITVDNSENTEQMVQNSSKLTIQCINNNEIVIVIDSLLHLKYGFAYPMTYSISIPSGSSQLKTYKKYNQDQEWSFVQEKTSADFFNGIEAVRYDYANNLAYVSLAFNSSSDSIYIKITNQEGNNIPIEYSDICKYYDNRDAVVTTTADDWSKDLLNQFNKAINLFRTRNLWFSGAVITNAVDWMDTQAWVEIQKQLDSGFVEVLSHSRTYPDIPYDDYESEIIGSKYDIINNLDLPNSFKMNDKEYVYAYILPYGDHNDQIDYVAGGTDYLVCRCVYKGFYDFTSWNEDKNIYEVTDLVYEIGTLYSGITDSATLKNTFDSVVQNHKIYHFFVHPKVLADYDLWGLLADHLDYISNRKNIWYTSFGHLYLYHFLEEIITRGQRRAIITVTGGGITRTVTVTQDPANQLVIKTSNQSVPYTAGNTTFTVTSNVNWVANDDADWLTISPVSDSSDGVITASYTENTTSSQRIGTITVVGSGITRTVTVTQQTVDTSMTNCPTNMISYWKLDEISGTVYYDSYSGHDGQSGDFAPSPITGVVNGAQHFNSVDNRINIAPNSDFDFSVDSSFSIEFWFRHSNPLLNNEVVLGRDGDDDGTQLHWWTGLNTEGKARFVLVSTSGEVYSLFGSSVLNDGKWHHIVALRDANLDQLRLYTDGNLGSICNTAYTSGFDSPTAQLNIGWLNIPGEYHFKGDIDEIAIYRDALDVNAIRYDYEKGLAGKGYCELFVLLTLKIFLEGPYIATGDSMSTTLNTYNYIPLTSPYSQDPRTVDSIPTGVVDWVLVQLKSNATDTAIISKSVFLNKNGYLVADDGIITNIVLTVAPGNYYIIIKHRNHLAVMSSNTVLFSSPPVITTFNFTTSIGQFYGTDGGKELEQGVWGVYAGDANGDGIIKYSDIDNDRLQIIINIRLYTNFIHYWIL